MSETQPRVQTSEDTAPLPMTPERLEESLKEASKAGTNLDTLVGRLVVEQGLATDEEVQQALSQRTEDVSQRSLVQVLVDSEFVTKRQIARLRQIIEAERSGQQIPGYKVLAKLGAGAMASVYKARQLSLDRLVAIKVLPKKFSDNRSSSSASTPRGRAAAQLNHPNIVQAYDVGRAGEYLLLRHGVRRGPHRLRRHQPSTSGTPRPKRSTS